MTDKPTLYSLADEARKLYEDLLAEMDEHGQVPEDSAALSKLHLAEGRLAEKAERCVFVLERLGSEAQTLLDYGNAFLAKARAIENAKDRLKNYMKESMEVSGADKLRAGPWTLEVRQNPPSVQVDDEDAVPAAFKTVVQEVRLDKKQLKDALKDGPVSGARLITGKTHLRVRPK